MICLVKIGDFNIVFGKMRCEDFEQFPLGRLLQGPAGPCSRLLQGPTGPWKR